jgi:hypothetical protein
MLSERKWWETMPIEPHYYAKRSTPRKTAKIMKAMTEIREIKNSMYPAKMKERGKIILGEKL